MNSRNCKRKSWGGIGWKPGEADCRRVGPRRYRENDFELVVDVGLRIYR